MYFFHLQTIPLTCLLSAPEVSSYIVRCSSVCKIGSETKKSQTENKAISPAYRFVLHTVENELLLLSSTEYPFR